MSAVPGLPGSSSTTPAAATNVSGESAIDALTKQVLATTAAIEELRRETSELREECRQLRQVQQMLDSRFAMAIAENKQLTEELKRSMLQASAANTAPGLPPPSPASLLPRPLRKEIVSFVKTHYDTIRARKESAKETGEKFSRLYDALFDELCAEKMLIIPNETKATARAALIEAVNNRQTMERRKRRHTLDALPAPTSAVLATDETDRGGDSELERAAQRPRLAGLGP